MKPKCDRCDREATVTEVLVKGGQKIERHLCESCARDAGVSVAPGTSLDKLMATFVMQHQQALAASHAPPQRAVANACRACGLAFAEFRQKGLLGCPECYKAFENQLGPLLERAHQGASFHCGKAPARGAADEVITQRLTTLRKQLSEAVAAEQYERAAAIRDELARAEHRPVTRPGAGPAVRTRPEGNAP